MYSQFMMHGQKNINLPIVELNIVMEKYCTSVGMQLQSEITLNYTLDMFWQ